MKSKLFATIFFIFSSAGSVQAVDIPNDLQGRWIEETQDLSCSQEEAIVTTIKKNSIDQEDVSWCEIKKINEKNGKYQIVRHCCSHDGCSPVASEIFEIKDKKLIINKSHRGKTHSTIFKRCEN